MSSTSRHRAAPASKAIIARLRDTIGPHHEQSCSMHSSSTLREVGAPRPLPIVLCTCPRYQERS